MKKINLLLGALIILLASAFATFKAIEWKVKDDYSITAKFQGKTKTISFKGLKAKIQFDEKNPGKSKITASIDANPLVENNEGLRKNIVKPDVLDVEKYPVISFEATSVAKTSNGYEATGNLTLKGVTKKIKLPFSFANNSFTGSFTFDPKEFNITDPEYNRENIVISLNIPVTQ